MPNKYPSPKVEFLKVKKFVGEHNNMVESPQFLRGVETARLEYFRQLHGAATVDPHVSMCNHQRGQGVDDFLKILFNLAEPPTIPPRPPDPDNLIVPPSGRPRRH